MQANLNFNQVIEIGGLPVAGTRLAWTFRWGNRRLSLAGENTETGALDESSPMNCLFYFCFFLIAGLVISPVTERKPKRICRFPAVPEKKLFSNSKAASFKMINEGWKSKKLILFNGASMQGSGLPSSNVPNTAQFRMILIHRREQGRGREQTPPSMN